MKKDMKNLIFILSACFLLLFPQVQAFDFSELENSVSEKTLDNGLKVLVMERHDAPVASFVTFCNVGGANDPKEYTGLAHMFEHMAFKGTPDVGTSDYEKEKVLMKIEDSIWYDLRAERKKGIAADSVKLEKLEKSFEDAIDAANEVVISNEFDNILEREGTVGMNAGTGMDMTVYMMSLPSNKMELWMAMESERFLNPVLREMYRERNVITEERRQTLENSPIGKLIDAMKSAAFTAHPYGISIIGHMSDIMNYTRDRALEYYKTYYVPSNLTISIVGDVDPKEVFKLAEKYWSRIPYSPPPDKLATIEPEQKGERRVELEDPSQPFIAIGWHIPEGTHPDFPALKAMSDYLGQGRTSLFYKNLVKDKKIAAQTGIFPGYPGTKYPCLLLAYAMPTPDHTNEECEEQIFAEIEILQNELISAEDVEKIKARTKASLINQMNSNMGLAMQLASHQNSWGNWRELFKSLDKINAVTAKDIQRVAQKYLTKQNRTVAKLNTSGS